MAVSAVVELAGIELRLRINISRVALRSGEQAHSNEMQCPVQVRSCSPRMLLLQANNK